MSPEDVLYEIKSQWQNVDFYATLAINGIFFIMKNGDNLSTVILHVTPPAGRDPPLVISPRISFLCSSEKGSPITSNNAAPFAAIFWESPPSPVFAISITNYV